MCDRNGGRRLRQWLIEQIDSELYSGLIWENEEKSMFRIPWKHAGKQDYNQEVDASIFKVGLCPKLPSENTGLTFKKKKKKAIEGKKEGNPGFFPKM